MAGSARWTRQTSAALSWCAARPGKGTNPIGRRRWRPAGGDLKLARVIGAVWATVKVETLSGYRLLAVQPLHHDLSERGAPLVAADTVSAAPGQIVLIVESREASKALDERFNPVDAAIVGIVDEVSLGSVPATAGGDG